MISIPLSFLFVVTFMFGFGYIILTRLSILNKLRQDPSNEELSKELRLWKARFYGLSVLMFIVLALANYLKEIGW